MHEYYIPNIQTYSEDKINLITMGYKQDLESKNIKYTTCPGYNPKFLGIQRTKKQNKMQLT